MIVRERLGAGGFGTVFRGYYGPHPVAVKRLEKVDERPKTALQVLLYELQILHHLPTHPNVLRFKGESTALCDRRHPQRRGRGRTCEENSNYRYWASRRRAQWR